MTKKVAGQERDAQLDAIIAWRDLPYGKFGVCAVCGKDREGDEETTTWSGKVLVGRPMYLYGHSDELCICLTCFIARGCKAPKQNPTAAAANGAARANTATTAPTVEQTNVIEKIVDLRKQGLGYPKIAAVLNDAGIPTFGREGAKWHGPTVRNVLIKVAGSVEGAIEMRVAVSA